MTDIRIGVPGASGRMGRMLVEAAVTSDDVSLSSALVREGSAFLGMDAGLLVGQPEVGVPMSNDLDEMIESSDVIIDFTNPELCLHILEKCVQNKVAMIIGTTGLTAHQVDQIKEASTSIPIVYAPNMSVGVNLLFKVLREVAGVIGHESDIEIYEAHHRYKKDAPSGTALRMGEVIADTLGRDLDKCAVYGREGLTGERDQETIGFATVRAGNIIGDHTAIFALDGERVEITHKSSSRSTYANGAIRAVKFLASNNWSAGFYDMEAVLGL